MTWEFFHAGHPRTGHFGPSDLRCRCSLGRPVARLLDSRSAGLVFRHSAGDRLCSFVLIALGILDDPKRALIISATITLVIAVASPVLHYRALRWWWDRGSRAEYQQITKSIPEWRAAADRSISNFRDRLLSGEPKDDLSWAYSQALEKAFVSSWYFDWEGRSRANALLAEVVSEAEFINELARTDPEEAAQEQEAFVGKLAQEMAEGSVKDPNWYLIDEWVALSDSAHVSTKIPAAPAI